MNQRQEGSAEFLIPRGHAAERLELVEAPLHLLAHLVLLLVRGKRLRASRPPIRAFGGRPRGNDCLNPQRPQNVTDGLAVRALSLTATPSPDTAAGSPCTPARIPPRRGARPRSARTRRRDGRWGRPRAAWWTAPLESDPEPGLVARRFVGGPGGVLISPHHRRSDEEGLEAFVLAAVDPIPQSLPEGARFPAAEPMGNGIPVPERLGQVAPGGVGARLVEDSFDEHPVAETRGAPGGGVEVTQHRFDFGPDGI